MKRSILLQALVCLLALSVGTIGCKKNPKTPTPIPGSRTQAPTGGTPFPGTTSSGPSIPTDSDASRTRVTPTESGIPTSELDKFGDMLKDTNFFKANTVYFDFDRSDIRQSERSKIEDVANYFKGNQGNKLLIEGHCDERGTEEYNRALGERRALALREYLNNLGVSPDRIRTISYGEDVPALEGHDESAWSRNRRGEFILLKPQ